MSFSRRCVLHVALHTYNSGWLHAVRVTRQQMMVNFKCILFICTKYKTADRPPFVIAGAIGLKKHEPRLSYSLAITNAKIALVIARLYERRASSVCLLSQIKNNFNAFKKSSIKF